MRSRTVRLSVVAAFAAILAPSLSSQAPIEREVEFVRQLATDLRFISLAQSEVERLQKTNRASDDFKLVAQLGIEISLIGARTAPREDARPMFKEALERSSEFINRYDGEPVADQARLTLVEACYEYGRFLLEEIELAAEEAPEAVAELVEGVAGVYRTGVEACDLAMTKLAPMARDDPESRRAFDYYRMWLLKGILLRENARAVERDRLPLATMARNTLEELILEVGEETGIGMRAYFELSKINEVLDNLEGAVRDYTDTIASIETSLTSDELQLTDAAQQFLFDLMQEAYDGATKALFLDGDVERVLQLCEAFRGHLKQFGAEGEEEFDIASPTYGHAVFLTQAQAMSESGQPELMSQALGLVQRINDAHPNDFIGQRAKSVIKSILDAQTSLVNAALLVEVAKGEMQAQNNEAALAGFKRALAAMTDAERRRQGLEVYGLMGTCYGRQERFLEAALTAIHGLEQFGETDGDTAAVADVLERGFGIFNQKAKADPDPALKPLRDKVTALLGRFGGKDSAAKLQWNEANKKFQNKQYAEAATAYAGIDEGSPWFEPAQGRIVAAWKVAGDHAKARAAIANYQRWLDTPAAKIERGDRAAEVNRERTLAAMAFYAASMTYDEATGDPEDPTKYRPLLADLEGFVSTYRQSGDTYLPSIYNMIARLQAKLGEVDKAEATYNILRNEFADHVLVAYLATAVFTAHLERVDGLEVEYTALLENNADEATRKPVRDRLRNARRATLNCGLEYMKNASEPQYQILWHAMRTAQKLENWSAVEATGQKIIELYGEDQEQGGKVADRVKPAVAEALLYQKPRRFEQAVELLRATVAENPKNWDAIRLLNLAQGGWVERDEQLNLVVVPGLGQPDQAYERHWGEYRKYALNPTRGVQDYDIDWYRFHWECYQFCVRAKEKDSKYAQTAQTLYRIARSLDDFETLRKLGEEGERLYQNFQQYR